MKYQVINKILIVVILLIVLSTIIFGFTAISIQFVEFADFLYSKSTGQNGKLFDSLLKIVAGIGIAIGLYFTYIRGKATQEAVDKQTIALNHQAASLELTRDSQSEERFKTAIEHLGDDKPPIILGGIVELRQLALDHPDKYKEITYGILASYFRILRSNADRKLNDYIKYDANNITQSNFILEILFSSFFSDINADLKGCDFRGLNMEGHEIKNISMQNSWFSNIQECIFENCNFDFASFQENLMGSKFKICKFWGAQFFKCFLAQSNFNGCLLEHSSFALSEFLNVRIENSELVTIDFFAAFVYELIFDNTKLNALDFRISHCMNLIFQHSLCKNGRFQLSSHVNLCLIGSKSGFFNCNLQGIRTDDGQESVTRLNANNAIKIANQYSEMESNYSSINFEEGAAKELGVLVGKVTKEDLNSIIEKIENRFDS